MRGKQYDIPTAIFCLVCVIGMYFLIGIEWTLMLVVLTIFGIVAIRALFK